jgi:hypothetical protein
MKKGQPRGINLDRATKETKKYRHKIVKIIRRWARKQKKGTK